MFLTCGVSHREQEMEMERSEALGFFHHNLETLKVQRQHLPAEQQRSTLMGTDRMAGKAPTGVKACSSAGKDKEEKGGVGGS